MSRPLWNLAMYGVFSDEAAPAAFDLLCRHGALDNAVHNAGMPLSVARRLLSGKLPAKHAKALLSLPWSTDEADVLIPLEKRKSVLSYAARHVPMGERSWEHILTQKEVDGALAEAMLAYQPLSEEYRRRFALHSGTAARVAETSRLATDDDGLERLRDLLRRHSEIFVARRVNGLTAALCAAVEAHPQVRDLLDTDVELHARVQLAMASCGQPLTLARQRKLSSLDREDGRTANLNAVLSYLACNPYLDRTLAVELSADLEARPTNPRGLERVQNLLGRRLRDDAFLDATEPVRNCSRELLEFLLAELNNGLGRPRSNHVMYEICHHALLTDAEARHYLVPLLLNTHSDQAVELLQGLRNRFPQLQAAKHQAPLSRVPESVVRRENAARRHAAMVDTATVYGTRLGERQVGNLNSSLDISGFTSYASTRLGARHDLWEALIILLPGFSGTVDELLTACEAL